MVMWFNVKEARERLLTKGFVYTMRPKKRRDGHDILMYNGFGKKGDIYIDFMGEFPNFADLEPALEFSGFLTLDDWHKAAGDSHFLYRVELQSLSGKPIEAKQ